MKTTKLLLCAVSLAAALIAAKASSQTLEATYVGVSTGFGVNGTVNNGGLVMDYPSGVMDFTDFDAFCVEPLQALAYGTTLVFDITDITTLANNDAIAQLIGGYLSSGQTAGDAAAVQWAIWEVTNELPGNGYDLASGTVNITSDLDTISLANQYLANMGTYTPVSLTYLTNSTYQDIVTWNVVPEPGSMALAALSLAALVGRRRR